MEREVGGGIGMGKTCKLKDVSFQCMTKFTTNKTNKQTNKQKNTDLEHFVESWQRKHDYMNKPDIHNNKNQLKNTKR